MFDEFALSDEAMKELDRLSTETREDPINFRDFCKKIGIKIEE